MSVLEAQLRVVECKGRAFDEDSKHDDWSQRLNELKKKQASRDGRHQFWNQFHRELLEAMETISEKTKLNGLEIEHLELEQRIKTTAGKFQSSEGRDINSNRRIDAQLKLVTNSFQETDERELTESSCTISSNRTKADLNTISQLP